MIHRYRYCGLVLDVQQSIKALDLCDVDREPDISVRFMRLRPPDFDGFSVGPNWAVGKDEAWWWLEERVSFRVRPGRIDVDTNDAEDPLIYTLLLEAPMIMAMIFRGQFCLNAAAVAVDNQSIVFCGASGSGRSTATAKLAVENGKILTDSLARIETEKEGSRIIPQGSGTLLWPDSIARCGIPDDLCRPERSDSLIRRVKLDSTSSPHAIDKIYWRNPSPVNHAIDSGLEAIRETPYRRRFRRFALMTAGRLWIEPAGQSVKHFQWCLSVAKHCRLEPAPPQFFDWTSFEK